MSFVPNTTNTLLLPHHRSHHHNHHHRLQQQPYQQQQQNQYQFEPPQLSVERSQTHQHHFKIMEWTNDDALELIEQYRHHTELWNRSDPKYKDKLCRFRAWSEIAERFGCSKAEVERKMNVLLTQYRREKHKMLVKLYQGIQPNPSKWYAFKRFDFMELGGGSGSAGGGSSSAGNTSMVTSANHGISPGRSGGDGLSNGHTVSVASLNGLSGFADTAAASGAASAAAAAAATTSNTVHRRKSKEMKYFGAMGLNLPLLIANSQQLETWNVVGQYSPPIGGGGGAGVAAAAAAVSVDRAQIHMPLSMQFSTSTTAELSVANATSRSLFSGSNNSDISSSPQKPMETADLDEKELTKCERLTPPRSHELSGSGVGTGLLTGVPAGRACSDEGGGTSSGGGGGGTVGGDGGGGSSAAAEPGDQGGRASGGGSSVGIAAAVPPNIAGSTESGSSPIPNQNMLEAHKNRSHQDPRLPAHPHSLPHSNSHLHSHPPPHSHHSRDQDELDIKQELVDYFHAPHPPAPPDSHRSYSSNEENRLVAGGGDSDDFAQDLRVSAAATAKGLDFSQFVLPRNLRRSSESIDEKFMPLNMRKLNPASATSTTAGQMLMNSLLSNESLSEDTSASGRAAKCASQEASTSAAAAAAALYAESLNKDDCDFIGSNVSLKLRSMDRTQRIIAEKLISEVLFYGQFNELERTAHIQPK